MKFVSVIFAFFLSFNAFIFSQETITIDAGTDDGSFNNYTGFIHGETDLESHASTLNLLLSLKPNFWRNSDWFDTQELATDLSVHTTLVISDFYANFKGGYSNAKPWLNWAEYESYVATLVNNYASNGQSPDYWDVWNEPNDPYYWSGNLSQLIECFKRTRLVLDAINPAIKMVGPSLNSYDGAGIEYILDSLAASGITLDAVSWHEFGLPDSLAVHTSDFNSRKLLNPSWNNPEIHINEYSPQQTNQIPAYRLGWFYHLEQNDVDWANTACWDNNDGSTTWSNCMVGLNGLFWHDEQSPLPVFWLNLAYAKMLTGKRIFCTHSDAKTLALSSKTDSLSELKILVGRFYSIDNGSYLPSDIGKDSSNVTITINNYPYLTNGVVPLIIQKIPKGDMDFQNSPLSGPLPFFTGNATVTAGVISISIPNFQDGDVYLIYLNSTDILGQLVTTQEDKLIVYPNPSSSSITILTENRMNEPVLMINAAGETVKEIVITSNEMTLDISNLPAGNYYLKTGWQIIQFVKN